MILLVPRERDGLPALEKRLGPALLDAVLAGASKREVQVYLPRFKIEMPAPVALKGPLAKMGMKIAFDRARADFSGMLEGPPTGPLYVSNVFHRALVEVNEEGTVAAAGSGVVMSRKMAPPEVPIVRADHPFMFLLRDRDSGALVIVGRLVQP